MLNSRGQEAIVFEVLIAVILMTFVFVIGGFAMNSLNQTKCSKEIDLSMSKLATSIEKAGAISIGSYSYKFSPSACFQNNKTDYELIVAEGSLCSSYCPGSSYCYLLQYSNEEDPVSPVRFRCVNISRYISINPGGTCPVLPGAYDLLPEPFIFGAGSYVFQSKSLTNPTMCIYYHTG